MDNQLYHAIKVNSELCFGCVHCMKVCPTAAIRIESGIAVINQGTCVDCGDCLTACPVDAIYVEQDDFGKIFDYKIRVAIVPAVFVGQFPEHITEEMIFKVMRELGFTHVYQAEHTVECINNRFLEFQAKSDDKPLISPFCPAIVRLIQVRFPGLTENFIPIKPPIDASAVYLRKKMVAEKGVSESEIGIFYVTPCAAKIAAVKRPIGEDEPLVDGVINLDFIYNKVFTIIKNRSHYEWGELKHLPGLSAKGLKWGLTGGESENTRGRCLAIEGISNVIEILELIENEEVTDVDFLELRACDQSCAGGVLVGGNRFLTKERLIKRAHSLEVQGLKKDSSEKHGEVIGDQIFVNSIPPRYVMQLDADRGVAIKKMERVRELMCFLPGIDCGACGAPNCKALAEDIVQRKSSLSCCVFLQRKMVVNGKLSPEHALKFIENTWGKERLNKDCKKKGAKNEGS